MTKKQKFYAVKKGNQVGIFATWEECQAATKGFSGPEFKSFESEEEAKAYLIDEDIVLISQIKPRLDAGEVVAFTDGSFDATKQMYGSGIVIFAPNNSKIIELSNRGNNEKYVELRNVAGEIIAVLNAVDWAWKNGFSKIAIFYDYEGVGKWASGKWKANKSLSLYYQKYIEEKKDLLQIDFVKVSGHSNNAYNDRADALAKGAIADNKVIKDLGGNSGYIISNVKEENIVKTLDKLKSECSGLDYAVVDSGSKKTFSVQFGKDKVAILHFNNIKMMVQGKRSNLFQVVTTGIIENISCGDFIRVLAQAYEISIDNGKVESDFKNELPAVSSLTLPNNILRLLKQATIDLSNSARGDIEFSKYTFSALKALEGVLKYNLHKCGILMTMSAFNMFTKDSSGIYKLQAAHAAGLTSNTVLQLENCYNHLNNSRHTLFHFGVIVGTMDVNTRMLNTKQEANNIIKATLKVIDENYLA